MTPLWSILVASITTRYPSPAGDLWAELQRQTEGKPVELLGLIDNFQRSVGEKRNMLLDMARGQYLSFLDDDDWIKPNFVEAILPRLAMDVDVVTWWQETQHIQQGYVEMCEYSLGFEYGTAKLCQSFGLWRGRPAHTNCWRSEIAKACRFPDKDCGEDVDFVRQACAIAKTEFRIPEVLTLYRFDSSKSTTKGDGWRMKALENLYGAKPNA